MDDELTHAERILLDRSTEHAERAKRLAAQLEASRRCHREAEEAVSRVSAQLEQEREVRNAVARHNGRLEEHLEQAHTVLRDIAAQVTTDEMDEQTQADADFEGAYDIMIQLARAELAGDKSDD